MSSLAKRLILTFTSVPALFSLIYFFPQRNHLGFALLTVVAVFIGSFEVKGILFKDKQKPLIPFWLPTLLPLIQYIEQVFFPEVSLLPITLVLLLTICLASEVFVGSKDNFSDGINRITRTVFLIMYPGFFSIFLIQLLMFEQTTFLLLMLFLLVFGNDTFAYVFGMWLGKGNRNLFSVSPNKSLAGFIGGSVSSVIISILWIVSIPSMGALFSIFEAIFIGITISLVSTIGDLIESALKRSANVKDSGTVIMGRGGIMDSIDSLLVSAPFFLILIQLFA